MLNLSKIEFKRKKKRKVKIKNAILPEIVDSKSLQIVNFMGYALVSFTLIDYLVLLLPLRLLNPVWELQTIGRLVDTSWALLLGLMLIFYRRKSDRIGLGELKLLYIISRATLFLGIAYFLAVPLLMGNTIRISFKQSSVANQRIAVQTSKVQTFESKLNEQSEAKLEDLMNNFARNKSAPNLDSPEDFKTKMLEELEAQEQFSKQKIEQKLRAEKNSLYKNTFKWVLGAILTGLSLLFVWKSTKWVRNLRTKFSFSKN